MILFIVVNSVLIALAMFRNEMAFRFAIRRSQFIYNTNMAMIELDVAHYHTHCLDYIADSISYDKIMFDLRKWTYKQFFPDEAV